MLFILSKYLYLIINRLILIENEKKKIIPTILVKFNLDNLFRPCYRIPDGNTRNSQIQLPFAEWRREAMKLSTRSRYGIHAMYDLAKHGGEGPQAIRSIAERQSVSEQYLEQLIGPLRRSELVRSMRGASGGYQLARAPEQISVGEIIRALEGPLNITDCMADADACERSGACPSRLVWERLGQAINHVLDETSLADMLADEARLNQ
jgi:Rrf2 family protein